MRITVATFAVAFAILLPGCNQAQTNTQPSLDLVGIDVGLPQRSGPVDLASITDAFRSSGGNAFLHLTGQPTPRAIEVLELAGVAPPTGHSAIATFDSLRIATVWGFVPASKLAIIAQLLFVRAIEPSADVINPH